MNELRTNYPTTTKEVTMELNFIKSGDYYIPDIKLKTRISVSASGDGCVESICDWHTPLLSPIWC